MPEQNDTLLELAQATYRYPDGSRGLTQCSLRIRRGTRNVLIGANGAGKTTLFQHANGLLKPSSGVVHYAGKPVEYSRSGLRHLRSRVGLVFQDPDRQLFSSSVADDVSFGPLNLGLKLDVVERRVAAALALVDLSELADKAVHNLSFGQKKRVCIAGVLAMQPELLILDEPMAGLDPAMQKELEKTLNSLQQSGITLLLATHDIDFAYRWAEHIHLMADGRCMASLAANELASQADMLSAAGLPLPETIVLHRGLVERGILPSQPQPRCITSLLALLAATDSTKENLCKTS